MQSFSNPQALNRYSYCLNNPLKYIDPMGHIVEFSFLSGLDFSYYADLILAGPEALIGIKELEPAITLFDAWHELTEVAPELTSYLEKADETVTIEWSNDVSAADIIEAEDYKSTGNLVMRIGYLQRGKDIRHMTCLMAHEGFHAAMYIGGHSTSGNTAANEAFAYSFSYQVACKLNYEVQWEDADYLAWEFRDINPFNADDKITEDIVWARDMLYHEKRGEYYKKPWGGPMWCWPGAFGSGRDEFLTVAQQVWIE